MNRSIAKTLAAASSLLLAFLSFSVFAANGPGTIQPDPATVPEPSILALFGLGFAGLIVVRYFKKK